MARRTLVSTTSRPHPTLRNRAECSCQGIGGNQIPWRGLSLLQPVQAVLVANLIAPRPLSASPSKIVK
jgi:hypothetical protein